MSRKRARTYSALTKTMVAHLGQLIRLYRKQKSYTMDELAERASISRKTLYNIEHGDMGTEIGLVFEVAVLVGVPLFGSEANAKTEKAFISALLSELPDRTHSQRREVHDDF